MNNLHFACTFLHEEISIQQYALDSTMSYHKALLKYLLTLSWTAHSQSGLHVLSQHHICPRISRPVPSSETKLGHPWQHG